MPARGDAYMVKILGRARVIATMKTAAAAAFDLDGVDSGGTH